MGGLTIILQELRLEYTLISTTFNKTQEFKVN